MSISSPAVRRHSELFDYLYVFTYLLVLLLPRGSSIEGDGDRGQRAGKRWDDGTTGQLLRVAFAGLV